MKLIKEIRDNAAILTLKGDFDSFVCAPFVDEMHNLLDNHIKYLIVDLRLVLFINSTAIGTLVKIHKEAKKRNGGLVLCRPSNFVNEVLDSLGLLSMFKIAGDPEEALEDLGASTDGMDIGSDSSVLMDFPGAGRDKCVAKMVSIDEEGMKLKLQESKTKIESGAECKVKFRLPLFRKGHYFESTVKIAEVKKTASGLDVACSFSSMKEDERKSIGQFVEEMKFLRSEARKG